MGTLVLVGKHRIFVNQEPLGSDRWFYSIGELMGAHFLTPERLQHIGPFDSEEAALQTARGAILAAHGETPSDTQGRRQ